MRRRSWRRCGGGRCRRRRSRRSGDAECRGERAQVTGDLRVGSGYDRAVSDAQGEGGPSLLEVGCGPWALPGSSIAHRLGGFLGHRGTGGLVDGAGGKSGLYVVVERGERRAPGGGGAVVVVVEVVVVEVEAAPLFVEVSCEEDFAVACGEGEPVKTNKSASTSASASTPAMISARMRLL